MGKIEPRLFDELRLILSSFGNKYFIDNELNRSKVTEDLRNYDESLLSKLFESTFIMQHYIKNISGEKLFQIEKLEEAILYNDYWDTSYTKYENDIGLRSNNVSFKENQDVLLSYPFKDCILTASMTKSDKEDKHDDAFINETIEKDEIDCLLDKKIFFNVKKYESDKDHEHTIRNENIFFNIEKDNLIIKGNNLLALHSLKDKFAGRVKCIYIDVPFGTKNDSFMYNDKFPRSTWLVFMKNRLEIAKEFLSEDGSIFVHLDESNSHYLKVLMDEIYGEENFVNEIIWRYRTYIGQVKDYFPKKHDVIFWYKKNIRPKFNKLSVGNFEDTPDFKRWEKYLDEDGKIRYGNHPTSDSRFDAYLRKYVKQYGQPKEGDIIYQNFGYVVDDVWEDIIALDAKNKSERIEAFSGSGQKPEALIERIFSSVTNENDLIMDFFMGTATTQAVAMKMQRRFIGIEQMDYIKTISIERLIRTMNGEQGGISKSQNWQGGGSFVYAELFPKNMGYLQDIIHSQSIDELRSVYERMLDGTDSSEPADISFRADLSKIDWSRGFEDNKRILIKLLDKNGLYYNFSEIDDVNVRDLISDNDYAFNKQFYEGGE